MSEAHIDLLLLELDINHAHAKTSEKCAQTQQASLAVCSTFLEVLHATCKVSVNPTPLQVQGGELAHHRYAGG